MDSSIVSFSIIASVIVSLLLWIVIGIRGHWLPKMIITSACLYACFLFWGAMTSELGWPVEAELPEKFQVNWAMVSERKFNGDSPAIYLWATPLNENFSAHESKSIFGSHRAGEPRAYFIKYNEKSAKQVREAVEALKKGKKIVGSRVNYVKGKGDLTGKMNAGKSRGSNQRGKFVKEEFIFYNLPPARLPNK